MEPENQREIDKAHGALGYARRSAAAADEAVGRLNAKVARLDEELTATQLAARDAEAAAASAHAELAVREADPLVAFVSTKGESDGPRRTTTLASPDPATGTGGN